jgi:GTP cyclohydrolase I
VVTNISVRSLCEHHLMPFIGRAHIAYVPGEFVTGLGKLSRVAETVAAKPQIQERLGEEIADVIERGLSARGVLVVLDMAHQCVRARGTRQVDSRTVTIASRGSLASLEARAEIMTLIGSSDV